MPIGIGPGLGVTRGGKSKFPAGYTYLRAAGQATASFLIQNPAFLNAVGAASASFVGSTGTGGGGGGYTPALKFNDARNSMYTSVAGF